MITLPVDDSVWIDKLNSISRQASLDIDSQGWIQDQMTGEDGELCIIAGAHQASHETEAEGLSHVLREVLDCLGHAEEWNDVEGRTQSDVVAFLSDLKVTEGLMLAVFGPEWPKVCYLAQMFGTLSEDEMRDWVDSNDQYRDYQLLMHLDAEQAPDVRERRARNAVAAAVSERSAVLKINPMGPSATWLTSKVIRPSLQGAMV